MRTIEITLNGVTVNAISKGSNFDVRISREEANRLLLDDERFDIMCKELGNSEEWVGATMDEIDEETALLNEDLETFEIWLSPSEAVAQAHELNKLPAYDEEFDLQSYVEANYFTLEYKGVELFIHTSNKSEESIKEFINKLDTAEYDNCMGGYQLHDISHAYWLNEWVFYRLKGETDFEVFAYSDHISNADIRVIEQEIYDETN